MSQEEVISRRDHEEAMQVIREELQQCTDFIHAQQQLLQVYTHAHTHTQQLLQVYTHSYINTVLMKLIRACV